MSSGILLTGLIMSITTGQSIVMQTGIIDVKPSVVIESSYQKPSNIISWDQIRDQKGEIVIVQFLSDKYMYNDMYYKQRNVAVFPISDLSKLMEYEDVKILTINNEISKNYLYEQYDSSKPEILSIDLDNENVNNGFSKGWCTWFVAKELFPYIGKGRQEKLWNGDAYEWYSNASKAGYLVGKTPIPGSIAVWKGNGYHAKWGHVGIILKVDNENSKILVKDMSFKGRHKVTTRREDMYHPGLLGYIYL